MADFVTEITNLMAMAVYKWGNSSYNSGNFEEDKAFVLEVGERVIDKYIEIISKKLTDSMISIP